MLFSMNKKLCIFAKIYTNNKLSGRSAQIQPPYLPRPCAFEGIKIVLFFICSIFYTLCQRCILCAGLSGPMSALRKVTDESK